MRRKTIEAMLFCLIAGASLSTGACDDARRFLVGEIKKITQDKNTPDSNKPEIPQTLICEENPGDTNTKPCDSVSTRLSSPISK